MSTMLPDELVISISEQWRCRGLQIRQLSQLFHPSLSSPSSIVIHGPEASGKSRIVTSVLASYAPPNTRETEDPKNKRHKISRKEKNADDNALSDSLRYSVVNASECITASHLLSKIISGTLRSVRQGNGDGELADIAHNTKCDHISALPEILSEILEKSGCKKFVLVLDGADEIRDGGHMLLAGLSRVGELIPCLCVVFVLRMKPRFLFLQTTSVPHIYFPPYTRDETLSIMTALGPPDIDGVSTEATEKLFGPFLSTLYDSLIGPTAGTIPMFKPLCEKLWPRFISPIVNKENPPGGQKGQWDFGRLLVKNRGLFQHQGEHALVHHIVSDDSRTTSSGTTNGAPPALPNASTGLPPSLPYLSTLVITAAFLAAHTPPRIDTVFFSKFTSTNKRARRRKRLAAPPDEVDDPSTTPSKAAKKTGSNTPKSSTVSASRKGGRAAGFLNPRPFPLERLLAIYHAIDPNPPLAKSLPVADSVYPELATLQRLRLLIPASSAAAATGGAVDAGEKWCLNVNIAVGAGTSLNGEWIVEMAKDIGVDIDEYLNGLME